MLIEVLVATTSLGVEPVADVDARLEKGSSLVHQAQYSEARNVLRSVIEVLDELDPRRGPALNNLGAALYYFGHKQGVEELYMRALRAIQRPFTEANRPIKNNLVTLYRRTGRFRKAEALYLDVLHYHEESSPDGISVAADLNRPAQLCRSIGRYTESEEFARRSVAMLAETGPAHQLAYSDSLQTLATAAKLQTALDDAETRPATNRSRAPTARRGWRAQLSKVLDGITPHRACTRPHGLCCRGLILVCAARANPGRSPAKIARPASECNITMLVEAGERRSCRLAFHGGCKRCFRRFRVRHADAAEPGNVGWREARWNRPTVGFQIDGYKRILQAKLLATRATVTNGRRAPGRPAPNDSSSTKHFSMQAAM